MSTVAANETYRASVASESADQVTLARASTRKARKKILTRRNSARASRTCARITRTLARIRIILNTRDAGFGERLAVTAAPAAIGGGTRKRSKSTTMSTMGTQMETARNQISARLPDRPDWARGVPDPTRVRMRADSGCIRD